MSSNDCHLLQDKKVPLQLAYEQGHKDVVNYLAKKDANVDPIQINKVQLTCMYNSSFTCNSTALTVIS